MKVAKALSGLSMGKRTRMEEKAMTMDEQEELDQRQQTHNVVVIDEVDQFNSSEKSFTKLVSTILAS